MDSILRALSIYLFLLVIVRISGRRTLGEMTSFDFVLLLVIGEATQQALLGDDFSITNAYVIIATLIFTDILFSLWKQRSEKLTKLVEGVPTILVADGKPLDEVLRKSRVDASDVLEAARRLQGLERMEQIKYAVLETSGGITVIPKER